MKNHRLFRLSLITLSALIPMLVTSCKDEPNTPPTAKFTIKPAFGTVDTTFTFDASGVADLEDPAADLQVRWDWESDSVFDTDFSATKTITHKYATGGTMYISVEVKDTRGATSRFTDFVKVQWNNRPPKAAMNITPKSGFLQDEFRMDASACSDAEDKNADLQVRFDFEGDGTWDTEYSKTKVVTHVYTNPGTFNVQVMVKDKEESTDTETVALQVQPANTGPELPKDPSPANNVTGATTRGFLSWSCTDPDRDSLKYDIYFGLNQNPGKVVADKAGASYETIPLEYNTTYYWKVVAKDPYGHEATGNVWSFTTGASVNPLGTFTDRRDGKVYKSVNINGQVWMAQNLNVGTMINTDTQDDRGDYQKNDSILQKYCYKNIPANCDLYGGLYQWDEAMQYGKLEKASGICPEGWHLPSDAEWHELVIYLDPKDGEAKAGDLLVLGSNSGFQALFSGYMIWAEKKYYDAGNAGYFWSSSENTGAGLDFLGLMRSIYRGKPAFQQDTSQKVNGISVRCIKDY
jgi:uncharacterized protein (TIGR02145 family)